MDKVTKDKLAGSPGENGGGQDAQKDLHSMTGRDETKRKTQESMERRSGKRPSSVGSEKMDRVGDRQGQMERYCPTGQSPQRAVAPTEEEEEYNLLFPQVFTLFEALKQNYLHSVISQLQKSGYIREFFGNMREFIDGRVYPSVLLSVTQSQGNSRSAIARS